MKITKQKMLLGVMGVAILSGLVVIFSLLFWTQKGKELMTTISAPTPKNFFVLFNAKDTSGGSVFQLGAVSVNQPDQAKIMKNSATSTKNAWDESHFFFRDAANRWNTGVVFAAKEEGQKQDTIFFRNLKTGKEVKVFYPNIKFPRNTAYSGGWSIASLYRATPKAKYPQTVRQPNAIQGKDGKLYLAFTMINERVTLRVPWYSRTKIIIMQSSDQGTTWVPYDIISAPGGSFDPSLVNMPDGTIGVAAVRVGLVSEALCKRCADTRTANRRQCTVSTNEDDIVETATVSGDADEEGSDSTGNVSTAATEEESATGIQIDQAEDYLGPLGEAIVDDTPFETPSDEVDMEAEDFPVADNVTFDPSDISDAARRTGKRVITSSVTLFTKGSSSGTSQSSSSGTTCSVQMVTPDGCLPGADPTVCFPHPVTVCTDQTSSSLTPDRTLTTSTGWQATSIIHKGSCQGTYNRHPQVTPLGNNAYATTWVTRKYGTSSSQSSVSDTLKVKFSFDGARNWTKARPVITHAQPSGISNPRLSKVGTVLVIVYDKLKFASGKLVSIQKANTLSYDVGATWTGEQLISRGFGNAIQSFTVDPKAPKARDHLLFSWKMNPKTFDHVALYRMANTASGAPTLIEIGDDKKKTEISAHDYGVLAQTSTGTTTTEVNTFELRICYDANCTKYDSKQFSVTVTAVSQDCGELGMDIAESKTKFDISDISELERRYLKLSTGTGKDINGDGSFDYADVVSLVQCNICKWKWSGCN